MKIFFLRLLFLLLLIFFEYSFIDVLFPWIVAPFVLIGALVAWALIVPFPRVLFTVLPLTILFDIVLSGIPGALTLYTIPFMYLVSFLSVRLLLEQRGAGIVLNTLLGAAGVAGYALFERIFFQRASLSFSKDFFFSFISSKLFFTVLLSVPFLVLAAVCIRRFEEYLRHMKQGDMTKIR